jgi:hypothetical protein
VCVKQAAKAAADALAAAQKKAEDAKVNFLPYLQLQVFYAIFVSKADNKKIFRSFFAECCCHEEGGEGKGKRAQAPGGRG